MTRQVSFTVCRWLMLFYILQTQSPYEWHCSQHLPRKQWKERQIREGQYSRVPLLRHGFPRVFEFAVLTGCHLQKRAHLTRGSRRLTYCNSIQSVQFVPSCHINCPHSRLISLGILRHHGLSQPLVVASTFLARPWASTSKVLLSNLIPFRILSIRPA